MIPLPYLLLAAVLLIGGGYAKGRWDGHALGVSDSEHVALIAEQAAYAGQLGAAREIAKLEVKHVTVQRKIERETREVPVYRDCVHQPDGVRIVNDALENRPLTVGDSKLPGNAGDAERR